MQEGKIKEKNLEEYLEQDLGKHKESLPIDKLKELEEDKDLDINEDLLTDKFKEPKEERNRKKEKNKNKKKSILSKIIIFFSIFLVILILTFLIFNLYIMFYGKSEKIFNNTYVGKVSLSGLLKTEAIDLLNEEFNNKADNKILLKYQDFEFEISPNDIGFKIEPEDSIEKAYTLGRDKNFYNKNKEVFLSFFNKNEIPLNYTYNEELFNKVMDNMYKKLPDEIKTKEFSYKISKSNLIISPGTEGYGINKENLLDELLNTFSSLDNNKEIQIPLLKIVPKEINLKEIKDKIYKKMSNARYNKKTGKTIKEVNGVEFAISLEEAEKIIKEKKKEYKIPLKITYAKIKKSDLDSYRMSSTALAEFRKKYANSKYNDVLGDHSSKYDVKDVNRTINLEVSSRAINGFILYPGCHFSFNSFVGRTVAADGYKKTFGYAGGKKVPMWGGGVCQISSGIYVAALEADLHITERYNHGCPVPYMPPGLDSATDWGSCDLRFINNRDYPIKILINTADGVSTAKIVGTKEAGEPRVVIKSSKSNIVKFKTTKTKDTKLELGTEKVIVEGLDGFVARSYKYKYSGDKLLSKTLISVDRYRPLNAIIRYNK